jgi:hypothetical protein
VQRPTLKALAVLASLTCSTAPLLGGVASAADATTRPVLVLATDTDGDGGHGLYASDSLGRHPLVAESDSSDVYAVTTSRDGSRVAYLQDLYDSAGDLAHERLVVRDTTTYGTPGFVRVVSDLTPASGNALDEAPALSPDGSSVVWSRITFTADSITARTMGAPVAAGAPATIADGVYGAAFVDAQTLLGANDTGPVTLPAAGGTQTPVASLTAADGDFAVSPDGAHLAWTRDTSSAEGTTSTAEVHVADLTVDAGAVTLAGDRTLVSGVDAALPAWSTDGSQVLFLEYDATGNGSVWTAPQTGSSPAVTAGVPGVDTVGLGYALADTTPPGSATLLPATLAGTAATVHWSLPADTDVYGVELTRTSDGTTPKTVTVPAPATSYKDSGLLLGHTYTYSAVTVDRNGNRSPGVSRQLTALAATASFPDPTSTTYYLSPSFRVGFPTPGAYTVQYRTNGTGALTTWVDHATATSQVFSTAKAGYSYGLLMTRYDSYGNSTAPTGVGTAVVPYDQTRATFSGSFATQALSGRYLGSATILKAAGSAARLVVNGNRLQVIGEKCASCGVMDVYVDGVRVAGVDTHLAYRVSRAVLYTRALTAGVNHTVVIKARGTAGHPNVVLDGFGVRH